MSRRDALSHQNLRELLHYSVVSGKFYWKVYRSWRARENDIAGHFDEDKGSVMIGVLGKVYPAGPLAFFWLHGIWPVELIDHKDRNFHNNAWLNLREASRLDNRANGFRPSEHLPGVTRISGSEKFQAQIQGKLGKKYLGSFVTQEEAHEVYRTAHVKEFGEFSPYYKELSHVPTSA